MNTSLIIRTYEAEGLQIAVPFTTEAYFNATEVAKAFNRRPNDWLALPDTQRYLNQLPDFLVNQKDSLVITKRGPSAFDGGTWLHPKLAVAFARWLDIRFAIWCDMQIDDLLRHPTWAGEVNARLVTALESLTGLLQRMAGDPGQAQHASSTQKPSVPGWVRILQTVVDDIAGGRYAFPFKFETVMGRDCLLIRCGHVSEHLSLCHDRTVLSRSLKRQLLNARVVVSKRRDPTIQRDRFFHFLALDLAALERHGVRRNHG